MLTSQLATQRIENRLQTTGIGKLVKIRERALGDLADGEVLLGLHRLAEVFDRPQTTHRRIEKGEQVRNEHVVKE